MKIKIVLADDHQITRDGLRALIEKQTDMEVVGEAVNGKDVVGLVLKLKPDLVVMDISMPDMNGIEAARQIFDSPVETKVIALSMHSDRRYVEGMLNAGASGYLVKECAIEDLIQAIRAVNNGYAFLSPKVTDMVLRNKIEKQNQREGVRESSKLTLLSSREYEILKLIVEGYDAEQIATRLYISTKTVSSHRRNIMDKLQIYNTADLVKLALRENIISI